MSSARTFGGISEELGRFDQAAVLLQPVIYDGTSTWGKGADRGFAAFLEAAENMELYDIETSSEVYRRGIHILTALEKFASPEEMYQATLARAREMLVSGKFLTFFGGEHSVSIGVIRAFQESHEDLTVLQIDAHADLRPEYLGTPYNHACAMYDASRNCNLVQVGIRSMDRSELQFVQPGNIFFMHTIRASDDWMTGVVAQLKGPVYISLDLDAFDPSIMPATGTPEPGGFFWYELLEFLRRVFMSTEVIGFDIVELAPVPHLRAPQFLAAKLYYKMLTYKFEL